MGTPCEHFFGIQELVDILTPYLTRLDVSRLARTCRRNHTSCTPAIYRELSISATDVQLGVFNSIAGMTALGCNVQHVKKLNIRLDELAYYFNCVMAFENLQSRTTTTNTTDTLTPQRPNWLPAPDPLTNALELVPLPKMTNLVDFSLTFEDDNNAYKLPSAADFRVMTAQLCWMLSLHPHLTRLHVREIHSTGIQGFKRLCRAIAGLTKLQELTVSLLSRSFMPSRSYFDLFFSCAPSVQRLLILPFRRDESSLPSLETWSANHDGTDNEVLMASSWRRQGLLDKLESLRLWEFDVRTTTLDILQVFAHCPNIKSLFLPPLAGLRDIDAIGEYVGKNCSKITTLKYRCGEFMEGHFLPFKIVEALPAQQLEEFEYHGCVRDPERLQDNLHLLRRHFAVLRRVDIGQPDIAFAYKIPAAFILKECYGLEDLVIPYSRRGYYVDLGDLIRQPWNCSRLKRLELCINGCELPEPPIELTRLTSLRKPYYSRTSPIATWEDEVIQFVQLELFYRQIGKLTALQHLVLKMARLEERGRWLHLYQNSLYAFPALLSLPELEEGGGSRRPAYLQHWAGLNDLRTLRGSFRADTEETKETTGWNEARFMREHWPRLEYAAFFSRTSNVTEPFKWLEANSVKKERPESLFF